MIRIKPRYQIFTVFNIGKLFTLDSMINVVLAIWIALPLWAVIIRVYVPVDSGAPPSVYSGIVIVNCDSRSSFPVSGEKV